ncbi:FUSC family protein [Donghicola sp.]|jgi:uncharacterized membrane protein YccC|uniref:FUSC family protein n=1 Tax=Donghicola sp. TaxID=1929294 RepID=UPI00345B9ECB
MSFVVATALGVDHAFWAAMPVWVVAQPWRGVTMERALWRLVGTIVGGTAGLALLAVSPSPWVTGIGMSARRACCWMQMLRTPNWMQRSLKP